MKSFSIFASAVSYLIARPEKWQSGRMRQSWKLLTVTGPGVRIPLSPQKETHNEGCEFFCFQKCQKFIFVNNWKQKTKHTKCAWVSMLAQNFLLGCTKWTPLSPQTSAKLKNKNHQVLLEWFFYFLRWLRAETSFFLIWQLLPLVFTSGNTDKYFI